MALRQDSDAGKPLVWRIGNRMWRVLCNFWVLLREASGDTAFEHYLQHMSLTHPDQPALSRKEYFKFRTEQKWNGISRCC